MNPYFSIEGLVGVSFFVFTTFLVLWRIGRNKFFHPVDFTFLAMGLVYGLIFPLVVYGYGYPGERFIKNSFGFTPVHTLFAVIAVLSVLLGWSTCPKKILHRSCGFFAETSEKYVIFWLYIMLFCAIFTQYLYTIDYGGFFGYFEYNRLIRSGIFDGFERSRFSFLQPFGDMAILSFLGFWGLLISRRFSLLIVIGLSVSLPVSAYVLFAAAGRVAMVMLILIIFMSIVIYKKFNRYVVFGLVLSSGPIIFATIFWISYFFDIKAAADLLFFVAWESSFVFSSFFAQLSEGFLFNMFYEIFVFPAFLAPSSLTHTWLYTSSDLNTVIIMGARKGVNGVTGGIPTDMLTFGLMQFHIVGVPIFGFIFGTFLRGMTAIAGSFHNGGLSAVFTAYVVLKIGVNGVFYSHPQHIIDSNFAAIAVLLGALVLGALRPLLKSSR